MKQTAYSSTMKIVVTSSSETSVNSPQTARRYIPAERTLRDSEQQNVIFVTEIWRIYIYIYTASGNDTKDIYKTGQINVSIRLLVRLPLQPQMIRNILTEHNHIQMNVDGHNYRNYGCLERSRKYSTILCFISRTPPYCKS
jgi:hypothetical protein